MTVDDQRHALAAVPRVRDPVPIVQEASLAGLDGCGKSCSHGDSIPGPSSPWRVPIPTALSRPTILTIDKLITQFRYYDV